MVDFARMLRSRRDASRAQPPEAPEELFGAEFEKKLEMLALVSRRVFAGRWRAERPSKRRGSGVQFAEHREYIPGDDVRFIDHNAYQRLGRLLLKQYEEEEDLSVHFLIDCSESMAHGDRRKFDHARRICAALAYVALSHLDRVTVAAISNSVVSRLPAARGKPQVFRILRFLRGLTPGGSTALAPALRAFSASSPRRGVALLLSDLYDPGGFQRGIDVLRYERFEPYVIHLVDPNDALAPGVGDLTLIDSETRQACDVTVTGALARRLGQAHAEYLASIESYCVQHRAPYLCADVRVPFDDLVLRVFRQGGLLR